MTTTSARQETANLIRLTFISAISALVSTLVGAIGIYVAATRSPQVIAATDSGRIIPVVALNEPHVSDSRVLAFAEECTRRAFSHDFVNFRTSMVAASTCFTSRGSKMFDLAMDPLLKDLVQRRMVMSVSVEPPVVVQGPYLRNGRVVWRVQTKMQLFRDGSKERVMPQAFIVEMDVARVELEETPRGIAIGEFNVRPTSN